MYKKERRREEKRGGRNISSLGPASVWERFSNRPRKVYIYLKDNISPLRPSDDCTLGLSRYSTAVECCLGSLTLGIQLKKLLNSRATLSAASRSATSASRRESLSATSVATIGRPGSCLLAEDDLKSQNVKRPRQKALGHRAMKHSHGEI